MPTGRYLGDMTDELLKYGPGSYITHFSCGGPKNYSFQGISPSRNKPFSVCKVKGINIDFDTSEQINFTTMTELVLNNPEGVIPVTTAKISVDPGTRTVYSSWPQKVYKVRSEKRRFRDDYDSRPYGFREAGPKQSTSESFLPYKTRATPRTSTPLLRRMSQEQGIPSTSSAAYREPQAISSEASTSLDPCLDSSGLGRSF